MLEINNAKRQNGAAILLGMGHGCVTTMANTFGIGRLGQAGVTKTCHETETCNYLKSLFFFIFVQKKLSRIWRRLNY
jgi:hypothetical protein